VATWPVTYDSVSYEPWWERSDGHPTCVRITAHEGPALDSLVLTPIQAPTGWDAAPASLADIVLSATDPDERDRLDAELSTQVVRRGGLRLVWRTGAVVPRWFELVAHRAGDHRVAGWIGYLVETRDVERDEHERRRRLRQLEAVIEPLPACIYEHVDVADYDGTTPFFTYSSHVHSLTGHPTDSWESDPWSWLQDVHPEDRERVRQATEESWLTGRSRTQEYRELAVDGGYRWILDTNRPYEDGTGHRKWVGLCLDITDQVEARDAQTRLTQLLQDLPVSVYEHDRSTVRYLSRCLSGYPVSDHVDAREFWFSHVHPDDRAQLEEAQERCIGGLTGFVQEYREVAADGTVRWVLDIGSPPTFDVNGEPVWRGVMMDVTERRRAERDLLAASMHFEHVVGALPALLYRYATDDAGRVSTGVGWNGLDGSRCTTAPGSLWDEVVRRRIGAATSPGSELIRLSTAAGPRWLLDNRAPFADPFDGGQAWYGLAVDVTAEKLAHEELEQARTTLTAREFEVFALLGEGRTNAEIGEALMITEKTAIHHVTGVLSKLGLRNRSEVAALASRLMRSRSTLATHLTAAAEGS
jgi:PAS domain S-box-containing protein